MDLRLWKLSIGYVAFFNGIEHEVTSVTSGYRITLTYNLYFDDGGPVSLNDAVSEHHIFPKPPNEVYFRGAFTELLENPEFLADGGTLEFGLRHVYPIKCDLKPIYKILKGSDELVYQSVLALGYEPVLYVCYDKLGAMIDKVIDFANWTDVFCLDTLGISDIVFIEGGVLVQYEGAPIVPDSALEVDISEDYVEDIEWVTPMTAFNRQTDAFVTEWGGNETYGDVCLFVCVGKAGDRLAYRTAAQLQLANRNSDRWEELKVKRNSV